MNDMPKDRTAERMNIIAVILVLISAFGNLIYGIVAGEGDIGARLIYICLVFLVLALRRAAVAGFFFLIFSLLAIIFVGTGVFSGEYEALLDEILRLVWYGLFLFIAAILFLLTWREKRRPKKHTE